jgi:hypothetical protein
VVPPGIRAGRFFPSVLISVDQRSFAVPHPRSTASRKSAITNQGREFDKAPVRDRVEGRTYNEPQGNREPFVLGLGLTKKCRTEKCFCPTCFCQQRTWSAARIQWIVCGRRLVHSMLLSPWHNMHAQRGSELGNGTADEHSGTLMRICVDRTSRSQRAAANPSLTGDQLVVLPGTRTGRFFPSVFIRDHQRSFAVPHPRSTASRKSAITNQGREFDKAPVRDRVEGRTYNEPQGNREPFVLGLGLTKKCRTEKCFCPTCFCQ